jgi:cysteinyl-tRNA synthetase
LIKKGLAYSINGDVYFQVEKYKDYGRLSKRKLEDLQAGARVDVDERKRHPMDFALWKRSKPGEPAWPSPWGAGRPGWHIECSAMSMKFFGERFDIHTGGTDLRFPHHEDEIAQSEGAVGHPVVSIWVHGGHLRLSGMKISKSSGNVVRPQELVERGFDPLSFRWLCFQTQYRSEMDFSWDAMKAADQRVRQLRKHMASWAPATTSLGDAARDADQRFREAIANDLHLPGAVAIVNEVDHAPHIPDGERYALLATWDQVLGLDLERDATSGWEPTEEMRALMAERDAARAEKDYAASDALRDRLVGMGLEVMDTASGTSVRPV